jgi:hypothetical protein
MAAAILERSRHTPRVHEQRERLAQKFGTLWTVLEMLKGDDRIPESPEDGMIHDQH